MRRRRDEPRPVDPAPPARDLALVLSGGSINGVLLELGFLHAVRDSGLWPSVGFVYGTSAGALSGWAVTLDVLDDHERFLMEMQPEDVFAAHDLWRTPLLGLHRYTLPHTVAERLGDPHELARRFPTCERELTVVTTDIGLGPDTATSDDPFERAFNSRRDDPDDFADAVFASAAISTFVLPLRIGDGVYADGGWVRNFPLAYAYREPRVQRIAGCRYRASLAGFSGSALRLWHDRMNRLSRLRVGRNVTAELREAVARQERGEPMHLVDTIARLSHIAVYRNSELEVQLADERDMSLKAHHDLRERLREAIVGLSRGRTRQDLLAALDEAFAAVDFPFERGRVIPRVVVDLTTPDGARLDITRRRAVWEDDEKRALIAHGRRLTEIALDGWEGMDAAAG